MVALDTTSIPAVGNWIPRTPEGVTQTMHVAVIHAADTVRLITAAATRSAVIEHVAEYVRQHAEDRLWPDDAKYVHRLFTLGERDAALALYFASVGARWDEEQLVIQEVSVRSL